MSTQPFQIPENHNQAVNLVVNALISRNDQRTMADGENVVYLKAIRSLFSLSSIGMTLLGEDFESIIQEGARAFAMMGFVPVEDYEVNLEEMTLIIRVDEPAVSDR